MPGPGRRGHGVRAVGGDDVAEGVFFLDHRLRGEGHAGRRRCRRLLGDDHNWLAAAGLTTTLLDVAEKLPALVVNAMVMVSALL